jgi:PKD repeat protein
VFATTGTHTVRLTVTNSAGSATTTNTISVY